MKKRQIKKQQLLDDIPDDDDEPIEKTKTKPAHAKPNTDNITSSINKYRFV